MTELFSQGHALYKEGKVFEWEDKKKVERYLFLFDDLILMMKVFFLVVFLVRGIFML